MKKYFFALFYLFSLTLFAEKKPSWQELRKSNQSWFTQKTVQKKPFKKNDSKEDQLHQSSSAPIRAEKALDRPKRKRSR